MILALGAGVGLGAAAHRYAPGSLLAATTAPSASAAPSVASAPAPSASASVSASPSAAAAPAGPCPTDKESLRACFLAVFPEDAFRSGVEPKWEAICKEQNPVRGGGRLRAAVVEGSGKTVTDTMRAWALFGWHEPAAFAATQARCCATIPAMKLPAIPGACSAYGPALEEVAVAVAAGPAAKERRDAALGKYQDSIMCIVRGGASSVFGQTGAPDGGAETQFKAFADRFATPTPCPRP